MEELKRWAIAAGVRAIKSAAQAVLVLTGSDMVNLFSVDWMQAAGVAAGMAFVSVLMSLAGLPEVGDGKSIKKLVRGEGDAV